MKFSTRWRCPLSVPLRVVLAPCSHTILCSISSAIHRTTLISSSPVHSLCSLQFRGEIDPGSDSFWNVETFRKKGKEHKMVAMEIEEEKVVYTKEAAIDILERLYKAGRSISYMVSLQVWRFENLSQP